jgi:hypothetical protein
MNGGGEDDHCGAAPGRRSGGGGGEADRRLAEKREVLVAEISARLRHVCAHLSEAEFGNLVRDIAATRLRFSEIDARSIVKPPSNKGAPDNP